MLDNTTLNSRLVRRDAGNTGVSVFCLLLSREQQTFPLPVEQDHDNLFLKKHNRSVVSSLNREWEFDPNEFLFLACCYRFAS